MALRLAAVLAAAIVTSCAHMTPASPCATVAQAVRADLASTGALRAGMNLQNSLFTVKNTSGELEGVAVDVMQELGRRLGVPVKYVMYETPGNVADDAANNKWDAAVLAIEPTRAKTIAFSPPMTEIQATYLVPPGSRFTKVSEVDSEGTRIAVSDKAGYELHLTRELKHAKLVRGKNTANTFEVFNQQKLDAIAGLRPLLLENRDKVPGARVLDGGFMRVNHGVGVPQGHSAGAAWVREQVEELARSGFVARSIGRHKVLGIAAVAG
jgi:ABC-type amino acid transport/signal transduction systems, periplasmic component/domain